MRPDRQKRSSEQKTEKEPKSIVHANDGELDVLKTLVVDEADVIRNLKEEVARAKSVFSIASPTGRVIFENFGDLSDYKRILVLLLGKYFALKLGLVRTAALGIREISEELGRPSTALSGDVGTLKKEGFVEKLPDRTYRIAYNRVREILGVILPPKPLPDTKEIRPGVSIVDNTRSRSDPLSALMPRSKPMPMERAPGN
jgi:hypothetical protein